MPRILVTGAVGQIGTELTRELRRREGPQNVLATSRRSGPPADEPLAGPFAALDVSNPRAIAQCIERHRIDTIYHLAAILSAAGEEQPQLAWEVNMGGLVNVLEAARLGQVRKVFWPSSIAAFGPQTPLVSTPQDTIMRPTTIYGVSKVAGELLCDYYFRKYRLDTRGVRYPGVISSETKPSGGTTDYAVEMFYAAVEHRPYTCFVRDDTVLPMIYIPDCIRATIDLMEADLSHLRHHNSFNVAAMSFSAGELAAEIRKHVPDFACTYAPDQRQAIADFWPRSLDDSAARREWGWQPEFDLANMTRDMLEKLRIKQNRRC